LLETIRAVAILRENKIDVVLNCLGDGKVKSEAEDLVEKLDLQDSVHFFGYVSENKVAEFYRNSDLLVFPTFHAEGFPMVIFNALGHGLPIVTTKIRAAADYLSEPENCFWALPSNPENVAEQIVRLYKNRELLQNMSENNHRLAANFTAEKIAPEYLEIYRALLRRR
jgi:glycosyltransferase involved in cell wall biosynthesis